MGLHNSGNIRYIFAQIIGSIIRPAHQSVADIVVNLRHLCAIFGHDWLEVWWLHNKCWSLDWRQCCQWFNVFSWSQLLRCYVLESLQFLFQLGYLCIIRSDILYGTLRKQFLFLKFGNLLSEFVDESTFLLNLSVCSSDGLIHLVLDCLSIRFGFCSILDCLLTFGNCSNQCLLFHFQCSSPVTFVQCVGNLGCNGLSLPRRLIFIYSLQPAILPQSALQCP